MSCANHGYFGARPVVCVGFAIIRQTTKITQKKEKNFADTHYIAKYTLIRTQLLAGGSTSTMNAHIHFLFYLIWFFFVKGFAPLRWMMFGSFLLSHTVCVQYTIRRVQFTDLAFLRAFEDVLLYSVYFALNYTHETHDAQWWAHIVFSQ